MKAFGEEILTEAGYSREELFSRLQGLPGKIQNVFETTARQIIEFRQSIDYFWEVLQRHRDSTHAGKLVSHLLGIPWEDDRYKSEADDRSAGYPLRRFAEFGILPGYEFPTEPATLRLLNDESEDNPLSVNRQFGIGQFQPDATVYARRKRWKVIGLDVASPWNPQTTDPTRVYHICGKCDLRYDGSHPRCPRCQDDTPSKTLPAYEFGGFIARVDENPILDEEDRYATRNRVRIHPQWDGTTVARWGTAAGWTLRLSKQEEVFWLNEGVEPTPKDFQEGIPRLHQSAMGYCLCPSCGRILTNIATDRTKPTGRRQARTNTNAHAPYGHGHNCAQAGTPPTPLAIATCHKAETLRLMFPVGPSTTHDQAEPLGLSLGFSLLIGFKHLHMLNGGEIDFVLEGPWRARIGEKEIGFISITFIDGILGGTGYLQRAAVDLHLIARKAIEHLDHPNCETACYRCLKSYNNQRYHEILSWPLAFPHLEALASQQPILRPLSAGDIDDPVPWLEAYEAGVGSPLEFKFLRLFEDHGIIIQKQVPISLMDGALPITIADFAIPERRLAIYIDGANYHVGGNVRRDRFIRKSLADANPPWCVLEFGHQDFREVAAVIAKILTD